MATLQAIHGRLIDLRRYTNVHLTHGRRPLGPTERYELWIKPSEGAEQKFTVNTRNLPARRGHEISLIVTTQKVPQVLGLANWSILDGVNYARSEAPPLVRPGLGYSAAGGCLSGNGRDLGRRGHGSVRTGGACLLLDSQCRTVHRPDPACSPSGSGDGCGVTTPWPARREAECAQLGLGPAGTLPRAPRNASPPLHHPTDCI